MNIHRSKCLCKKVMNKWIANKLNNIINYVNDAYINKQIEKWENEKKAGCLLKSYVYMCIKLFITVP
jgi:hypothetical protein